MLEIDLSADPAWGAQDDWQVPIEQATRAALAASPHGGLAASRARIAVSVRLADDAEARALNHRFRQRDAATNVLSFPMVQADLLPALANTDDGEVLLGDIVLARGVCVAEAADKGVVLADHVAHLVVHGTFHLLGYDHGDDAEAEHMERLEAKALASIGVADPYAGSSGLPDDEGQQGQG